MNKNKPTLHVSIYFKGDPSTTENLQKSVSEYSSRIADDPFNPNVEFCFDSQKAQEEKLTLIELSYNKVLTRRLKQSIKNNAFFYSTSRRRTSSSCACMKISRGIMASWLFST